MKEIDVRNPRYTEGGPIDCEIRHKELGWIPFTASPLDTDKMGREIFALAQTGAYGPVAPYIATPKPELSDADIQTLRRQAYMRESDPLKIEAEYDALAGDTEPDYTAWIAKVEEIKTRYPLRSSTNG